MARTWVGAWLAVASVIAAVAWAVLGWLALVHHVDAFQRFAVPGSDVVVVNSLRSQVLYIEGPVLAAPVAAEHIAVTDPTGAKVTVTAYQSSLRYDAPGALARAGRAVATFEPTVPGAYTITVDAPADPQTHLALGDRHVWDAAPQVLGAGLLLLLGTGFGLTLVFAAHQP